MCERAPTDIEVANNVVDCRIKVNYIICMQKFEDQPLRQRKYARTKLALLEAFTAGLDAQTYEAIRIKDLSAAAEISEASFFNYFQRKEDLLTYFIQVWSLDVGWHARKVLPERGALAAIEEVFLRTAADVSQHPRVMAEIIVYQARKEHPVTVSDLTLAERLLAFPALEGIESVPASGLEAIFPELIGAAKASGELPEDADADFLFVNLATLFFGAPVVLRVTNPAAIGALWQAQLAQLFRAVGARPAAARRERSSFQSGSCM
jgi:AcrR family transcriptional regulator